VLTIKGGEPLAAGRIEQRREENTVRAEDRALNLVTA